MHKYLGLIFFVFCAYSADSSTPRFKGRSARRVFPELRDEVKQEFFQAIRDGRNKDIGRFLWRDKRLANTYSSDGLTPLHEACYMIPNKKIIKTLLHFGANVNATCRKYYNTPLHMVSQGEDIGIAELLIANGANVKARNNYSYTPLHYAWLNNSDDSAPMSQLLLKYGASAYDVDIYGRTPVELCDEIKAWYQSDRAQAVDF